MEIVYHLGVHLTDEERIPKLLLKNRAVLQAEGIIVPWPRQYRYLFRDLLGRLGGGPASAEMQDILLDAVMVQDAPARVIFAHENFLGPRSAAVGGGRFYPGADRVAAALRNLFPDTPVGFTLAVRNPATFLPALFAASQPLDYGAFLGGADPAGFRWSEMLARLARAVPGAPVTVWCNEDSPVLWPAVLGAIAGHGGATRLALLDEFPASLLTEDGARRMRSYFAEHPPDSEARRRRAVAAFLERFGRPEAVEVEVDLPGWDEALVGALSAAYDADMEAVAALPGVRFIG